MLIFSGIAANGASKWWHGVLGPDGKIYGMPYNALAVLVIDPVAVSVDATSLLVVGARGNEKWRGGVLEPRSGLIYGIPYSASHILVIDPTVVVADAATISVASLNQPSRAWDGAVVSAGSGKIFAIPHMSAVVMVIEPACWPDACTLLSSISVTGWPSAAGSNFAWSGGVLAADGKILGIPYNAELILEIDPVSETASTTVGPSANRGLGLMYSSGARGPDNRIYGAPFRTDAVLRLDSECWMTPTCADTDGDNFETDPYDCAANPPFGDEDVANQTLIRCPTLGCSAELCCFREDGAVSRSCADIHGDGNNREFDCTRPPALPGSVLVENADQVECVKGE